MYNTKPCEYGLDHESFRVGQPEALERIRSLIPGSVLVIEAPTGSGKTVYPAALANVIEGHVMALSHTNLLLKYNYGQSYGFDYLFGKGNYPCALDPERMADNCLYKKPAEVCERYTECEYYRLKEIAMRSKKCALNYAYWLTAQWPRLRMNSPNNLLFLDEAHLLRNIILEHGSITIDEPTRSKYGLPPFEEISTKGFSLMQTESPVDKAKRWLINCVGRMTTLQIVYERKKDEAGQKEFKKVRNLALRIEHVLRSLEESPEDWYIRSGRFGRQLPNGYEPGFVCKPFTARHHFMNRFSGSTLILMSATIGDFDIFTKELGIAAYEKHVVPPIWKPEQQPVYYFEDAPRMNYKSSEVDKERQIDLAVKLLDECPRNWTGILQCSSKNQARDVAQRLARRGYYDRLWMPTLNTSTYQQLQDWERAKQQRRGALAVTYSWGVGTDLGDCKINLMMKTPWGSLANNFNKESMERDPTYYRFETALTLMQWAGRTRRGNAKDYDEPGNRRGMVAVLDGNWTRIKSCLGQSFRESMTPW